MGFDDDSSSISSDDTSKPYVVMIACVTVEVAMVVSPALFYEPDEIHIFRYIRDPTAKSSDIYGICFEEVRRRISDDMRQCRIIEHSSVPVYDYVSMLSEMERTRSNILRHHNNAAFLVNISSGPPEFSGACHVFAATNKDVKVCKVSTEQYTMSEDEYIRSHYSNGRMTGMSMKVSEPKEVRIVHIEKPDEVLVRALRIYAGFIDKGKHPGWKRMMSELKSRGLWTYEEMDKVHLTDMKERERQFYYRNYHFMWKRLGWTTQDRTGEKSHLTDEGRTVISMFYPEE